MLTDAINSDAICREAAWRERQHDLAEARPCKRPKNEPSGYLAWHAWAERKAKTHRQVLCKEHGLWHVWIPKKGKTNA